MNARRSPARIILNHLAGRSPLTAGEQRRLDLDGDGLVTATDLLLWRTTAVPSKAWSAAPAVRLGDATVLAGGKVVLGFKSRAVLKKAVWEISGRQSAGTNRTEPGCEVDVPALGDGIRQPVWVRLWLVFEGCAPARVVVRVCPGPMIVGITAADGGGLLLEVQGMAKTTEGVRVLVNGAAARHRWLRPGVLSVKAAVSKPLRLEVRTADGISSNEVRWPGRAKPKSKT